VFRGGCLIFHTASRRERLAADSAHVGLRGCGPCRDAGQGALGDGPRVPLRMPPQEPPLSRRGERCSPAPLAARMDARRVGTHVTARAPSHTRANLPLWWVMQEAVCEPCRWRGGDPRRHDARVSIAVRGQRGARWRRGLPAAPASGARGRPLCAPVRPALSLFPLHYSDCVAARYPSTRRHLMFCTHGASSMTHNTTLRLPLVKTLTWSASQQDPHLEVQRPGARAAQAQRKPFPFFYSSHQPFK
jgi:hypothetical protein